MKGQKIPTSMSLLRAFILSMLAVALLFLLFAILIWVSVSDALRRESVLVSDLLPELDSAFQLTTTTAGLQSQGFALLTANNIDELENDHAKLRDTIARSIDKVSRLSTTAPAVQKSLKVSIDNISQLTTKIADNKRTQFELQQRVLAEQQAVLEILDNIERFVQQQIAALTEQLHGISEMVAEPGPSASSESERDRMYANWALELESIDLSIQSFLLFSQDLALLKALIEKVPLLSDSTSLRSSEQSRTLRIGALVTRSIYLSDKTSSASLLQQMRVLRSRLHDEHSLLALQKKLISNGVVMVSLGEQLSEPLGSILLVTDDLRDNTSHKVSKLATQILEVLTTYRIFLIVVVSTVLLLLAAICYWLLYKNTVLPLLGITRQLDDVGSVRFPTQFKPYLFKELNTLSAATLQLDKAQKDMITKDLQLQGINENLNRANQELEQFAHVASHDLQEPLRKLRQFSDLLDEEYGNSLDEDGKYFVKSIRGSAKRMSNLISETLAFSRAGNTKQKLVPVDLTNVVQELRDEMELAVSDADAVFEVDALPTVLANRLEMAQLFRNLITNALKYRKPDTAARLSIQAVGTREGTHGAYVIKVKDNGVGIHAKYLDRIFEPFERFHNQDIAGTGLGLAICRKVCLAHRWELGVSSELGTGTTFEIRIPPGDLIRPAAK